jgi:DNA-binding transcriptional LysR family regulator
MGNRGDLHGRKGEIVRDWRVTRWIACTLTHPRGVRATFDTPGRYTPLFFADEPTALAAGHRPCAECRRADYDAWREGWRLAFGVRPSANVMDAVLHAARISAAGTRITFMAQMSDLPDGVMVTLEDYPETAMLLWRRHLHPWSHDGYGAAREATGSLRCSVLTPAPSVAVLSALASHGTHDWPGFFAPRI